MDEKDEFVVRDRRSSSPEPNKQAAGKPESDTASTDKRTPAQEHPAGVSDTDAQAPEVDFPTFILSLATSAQISLGAIPHPETNKPEPHLPSARQIIDVLGMLKEKTKGNLSKEEDGLLEQVLFSLRMHYVRATESQKKSGGA